MMYLRERQSAARSSSGVAQRVAELPAVTTSRRLNVKHPKQNPPRLFSPPGRVKRGGGEGWSGGGGEGKILFASAGISSRNTMVGQARQRFFPLSDVLIINVTGVIRVPRQLLKEIEGGGGCANT